MFFERIVIIEKQFCFDDVYRDQKMFIQFFGMFKFL